MDPVVDAFISVPKFGDPPQGPEASGEQSVSRRVATKLRVSGPPPSARGGHTATLVGNKIYVFGGHELRGAGKGFIYHNGVYVLDLKELRWVPFQRQRGTPAAARYGHTACLLGSRIVIFGGKGGPNLYFQDLHALDVETNTWYKGPSRPGDPPPRFWHTSNMSERHMYVFGGVRGSTPLGDLYSLDLKSMEWRELKPRGKPPRPRFGHSSVLVNNYLVVHGGMAKTMLEDSETDASLIDQSALRDWYLGDVHALSLSELTWHRLRVQGEIPSPRFGHTLGPLGNSLVIFGGWPRSFLTGNRLFTTTNKQPERPESTGREDMNTTAVAAAAAATGLEPVQKIPFQDAAALCSYTGQWDSIYVRGKLPAQRYGHSCTPTSDGLVIIGGWTSPVPQLDVILIRLEEKQEIILPSFPPEAPPSQP